MILSTFVPISHCLVWMSNRCPCFVSGFSVLSCTYIHTHVLEICNVRHVYMCNYFVFVNHIIIFLCPYNWLKERNKILVFLFFSFPFPFFVSFLFASCNFVYVNFCYFFNTVQVQLLVMIMTALRKPAKIIT